MLADPPAAEAVATGPDGIAAGMSAGKGYVDVSTVDAGTAQKISKVVCVFILHVMHVLITLCSGSSHQLKCGACTFVVATQPPAGWLKDELAQLIL